MSKHKMNKEQRRSFLKKIGISLASLSFSFSGLATVFASQKKKEFAGAKFQDDFAGVNDRTWIGERFWAIPMEDWKVKEGRIEFNGVEKLSRVNVLTAVIAEGTGEMKISVETGLMKKTSGNAKGGSTGFSIGIKDELDTDVKSACYFGKGIYAGVTTKGSLFIADKRIPLPESFNFNHFNLEIKGKHSANQTQLILTCKDTAGKQAEIVYQTNKDISGLVALVNNFETKGGEAFWFKNFGMEGSKIKLKPQNSFGPILWSMYTLSKGILKIGAQMPPLGVKDNKQVDLYLKQDNTWKKAASQDIDETSFTAHFQLENWDSQKEIPYKLAYKNGDSEYKYEGTVRKEPRTLLRFGGLTCQESAGFPYTPLVKNLQKHNPDILFFSGDQIYEGNGGYPIKRQPESNAVLSYLGKWYMFGWAFGDIMRDRPTICTPDDHDAFQGNLWGEGGEKVSFEKWKTVAGAHGGYVQTPNWVNMVTKTQCGHMPSSFNDEPLHSGIKSWYTDLLYGTVSFAIISDRMFKSGPEIIRQGEGRIDSIPIDTKEDLEDPNLEFLGDRQMQFLEHWTNDWNGATMKVLLSQTLFAGVGTHHGPKKEVRGDLDSGGWPKQKRDDALRLIRKACAFHINGDQHLPFIVQYNLDEARDAGWTFCTPAISVGYPRWAQPDLINMPHTNRPEHNLPNTGIYKDTFGSLNYIYAVGNPKDNPTNKNRYLRAQDKASGFGLITFNTNERTIKMEAFRFLADKDKPTANDMFSGWPLTIAQTENDGRKPVAFLPKLEINKLDQVVKIINESNNEIVSVLRIKGTTYQPAVFSKDTTYGLAIGEEDSLKLLKGIEPAEKTSHKTIQISV